MDTEIEKKKEKHGSAQKFKYLIYLYNKSIWCHQSGFCFNSLARAGLRVIHNCQNEFIIGSESHIHWKWRVESGGVLSDNWNRNHLHCKVTLLPALAFLWKESNSSVEIIFSMFLTPWCPLIVICLAYSSEKISDNYRTVKRYIYAMACGCCVVITSPHLTVVFNFNKLCS